MFIADDIGALDRGKNPDLIECIFLFLFGEVIHFDFLESIDLSVDMPLNFVDTGVSSFTFINRAEPNLAIIAKSFNDIAVLVVILF